MINLTDCFNNKALIYKRIPLNLKLTLAINNK